jgi:hypothetical protein
MFDGENLKDFDKLKMCLHLVLPFINLMIRHKFANVFYVRA